MTSKQVVHDCVAFSTPEFLPIFYFNKNREKSDIMKCGYTPDPAFVPQMTGETEWGYVMTSLDETLGQPENCPLEDSLDELGHYSTPNPDAAGRYENLKRMISENPDRYIIASLGISGFGILTSIRGFANTLMDLYLDNERILELFDRVISFENGIIRNFGAIPEVDAISFGDDWGSQQNLFINPEDWRRWFKPRYRQQFDLVHHLGKKVYFHCCGKINAILDDLIEIGADILNLNQPDLLDLDELAKHYRGRVCFNCPVDHQTVAIFGDDAEIRAYTNRLADCLSTDSGGFIAHIEEYRTIGMTDENYHSICNAFETLRDRVY